MLVHGRPDVYVRHRDAFGLLGIASHVAHALAVEPLSRSSTLRHHRGSAPLLLLLMAAANGCLTLGLSAMAMRPLLAAATPFLPAVALVLLVCGQRRGR